MVFHLCLSDSKFPQVSRTLLGILVDLYNALVWIVSIRPPISNSSISLSKPLVTVPNASITIGITTTLTFNNFLSLDHILIVLQLFESINSCLLSLYVPLGHLYSYFHNVSADMSSSLLQVFVELENLHGTSNYILY